MNEIKSALAARRIPDFYTALGGTFESFYGNAARILLDEEYGHFPKQPTSVTYKTVSRDDVFCAGKAPLEKTELTADFDGKTFTFPFYTMIPKSHEKLPFFILINFRDSVPDRYLPSEELCDNGYAVLSFCYKDVTSDDGDFTNGLSGVLFEGGERGETDCGKIAMWSWAASRILDYALTREELDGSRATVIGHSRLGKTALFTGAFDKRFFCAVSNDSGCSGAALHRGKSGENIEKICTTFQYWFCPRFAKYADRENELPFDQHMLIAMNLPHYVHVGSAEEDLWADPTSEFLSCAAAGELAEKAGFENAFVCGEDLAKTGGEYNDGLIGYHIRPGKHYFSRADWLAVMRFLKSKFN